MAAIRMTQQTALAILNLDDRTIQLSITQGSVQIHLRSLEPGETFEVATPNVAVTLLRPGDYRVDADGDNAVTTVTVRGGDAAVTGGGIAFPGACTPDRAYSRLGSSPGRCRRRDRDG